MRNTALALILAATAALSTSFYSGQAQADTRVRVYVGLGDVMFVSGRPYYRYDRQPIFVSYDGWGHPRYYRYVVRYGDYDDPYVVVTRPYPPAWGYYRYHHRDWRRGHRDDGRWHRDGDGDGDDHWHH